MLVVYYLQMHPLSSGHIDIHSELVMEWDAGCFLFQRARWSCDGTQGCFPFAAETVSNAWVISSSKSCASSHPTLKRMKPSAMASSPQRALHAAVVGLP